MPRNEGNLASCADGRKFGTLLNREKRQALSLKCNRWACRKCGPRKAERVQKRLRSVTWHKLITLTMPPGYGWADRRNLEYQARHLRSFWTAITRRFGPIRYVWVREIGKERLDCVCLKERVFNAGEVVEPLHDCVCGAGGGRLHLHILLELQKWIEPGWLKATAQRCGFGWIDVRAIRGEMSRYVTKYLAKGHAMPFLPRTRRVQMRGVEPLPKETGWSFTWEPINLAVPKNFDGLYCEPGVDFWRDTG